MRRLKSVVQLATCNFESQTHRELVRIGMITGLESWMSLAASCKLQLEDLRNRLGTGGGGGELGGRMLRG
jgi:hypothetical protein